MITLRQLVRFDTAIASITARECNIIAAALDILTELNRRWYLRLFLPRFVKDNDLTLRMLAASLGRTPEEARSLHDDIQYNMDKGMLNARH